VSSHQVARKPSGAARHGRRYSSHAARVRRLPARPGRGPRAASSRANAHRADFGSAAVANTRALPHDAVLFESHPNGLPIYGPGNAGVTYVWRAYPVSRTGITAFFWGNDDGQNNLTFIWLRVAPTATSASYPSPANRAQHKWEVSVEQNDFLNGDVQYNRWHTQALRVWVDGQGRKHHEFYWDLPLTDPAHVVERISDATWGTRVPPAPALTWGDAPWAPGNEVWNGILRGIQIYATALSGPDLMAELAQPGSTAAGQASIWYLNVNPTPADIGDKSGRGHHPAWVGPLRPALWAGGRLPWAPPAAPTNLTVRPGV
jgi:hypothetical protein